VAAAALVACPMARRRHGLRQPLRNAHARPRLRRGHAGLAPRCGMSPPPGGRSVELWRVSGAPGLPPTPALPGSAGHPGSSKGQGAKGPGSAGHPSPLGAPLEYSQGSLQAAPRRAGLSTGEPPQEPTPEGEPQAEAALAPARPLLLPSRRAHRRPTGREEREGEEQVLVPLSVLLCLPELPFWCCTSEDLSAGPLESKVEPPAVVSGSREQALNALACGAIGRALL